jgi:hypothetical protein
LSPRNRRKIHCCSGRQTPLHSPIRPLSLKNFLVLAHLLFPLNACFLPWASWPMGKGPGCLHLAYTECDLLYTWQLFSFQLSSHCIYYLSISIPFHLSHCPSRVILLLLSQSGSTAAVVYFLFILYLYLPYNYALFIDQAGYYFYFLSIFSCNNTLLLYQAGCYIHYKLFLFYYFVGVLWPVFVLVNKLQHK